MTIPAPHLVFPSYLLRWCASSRVSATAINVQSSTKLVDSSDLLFVMSIRSAL